MLEIIIAGDLCPRDRCAKVIEDGTVESCIRGISDVIRQSDYSLVNLECPIIEDGTPIKKQGPNLKTSSKVIDLIKCCGFKGVTLANNHFYDYGDEGVINTIRTCKECGIDYVGGGENLQEARGVLYKKIKEKTVAFVNVCEYEFSIATEKNAGSNPIDIIKNYYDIKKAKERADFVVVIVHGGHEHYNLPSPRMQDTYRFFIEAGADAVVNHHQHCYSGYEFYKEKPIVYGLGNFYFDHPNKRNDKWNEGYMLNLKMGKSIDISLTPYIQCNIKPSVELMTEAQLNSFNERIKTLNATIQNRGLMETEFNEFCKSKKRLYMSVLEPYPSIYLKYIYRKIGLPSLLKGKSFSFVKNFIMCESHLDVIKNLLK
ncbi:MAG: CapA family protein [Bacteroidales bacterium]|nr:CapA family protein [Bacteroidales bacterium]